MGHVGPCADPVERQPRHDKLKRDPLRLKHLALPSLAPAGLFAFESSRMALSTERLRELLSYDAETGDLAWLAKRSNRCRPGNIAGTLNRVNGYRYIHIDGAYHLAHRVIWQIVHGEKPSTQIDHINCVKTDNRLSNLRKASTSQNHANIGITAANTSGFKGVTKAKGRKRWCAAITKHRKHYHLGCFDTKEEASAAYQAAAAKMFGEFARAA